MNLTLSVPEEVAAQAKEMAAREGKSLSAWFRDRVALENQNAVLEEISKIDPETASAIGSALPMESHPEDPRWRALSEKYLK